MEKYITDERTGLKYELVGDYYLIAGDDDPKQEPIGIWGQRHGKYLCEHKHAIYSALFSLPNPPAGVYGTDGIHGCFCQWNPASFCTSYQYC